MLTLQTWLYRHRDPASWLVAVLGCLLSLLPQALPHPAKVPGPANQVIAMIDLPSEVAPPPEPPAPATPPTPRQAAEPAPRPINPLPMPRATPSGVAEAPAAIPQPAAEPTDAVTPATDTPRPTPPAPPSSAAYEQRLLAAAEGAKRYPSSREARLTHPEGIVRVWLELERDGRLIGVGVETSSHSNLLDQEALRTIRQIAFPPFPDGIYPGEATHRFIVNMKYEIQNS